MRLHRRLASINPLIRQSDNPPVAFDRLGGLVDFFERLVCLFVQLRDLGVELLDAFFVLLRAATPEALDASGEIAGGADVLIVAFAVEVGDV